MNDDEENRHRLGETELDRLVFTETDEAGEQQVENCGMIFLRYLFIGVCHLLMLIPLFWPFYVKVFDQYKRCVHFRLGKYQGPAKGPGVFIFIPFVDTWSEVDLRVITYDIPTQEMMTKDSVTVAVNGVCFYHVADPVRATMCVRDHAVATTYMAKTTLRSVVGENELDTILQQQDEINARMTEVLDIHTDPWGVKVLSVELKDVQLPKNVQRAMGSQAEAERERRAKIIFAQGELQSAGALLEAANTMAQNPATVQLRYLQTLTQISQEQNDTTVFPVPNGLARSMNQGGMPMPHIAGMPRLGASV